MPLSLTPEHAVPRPRWHSHAYNRADLYRLAAALGWLPRRARLALARRIGRLVPRLMPAEEGIVRRTLARVTGATGSRLDALTIGTFTDFAMCFSDLVSTNRQPAARLHDDPWHPYSAALVAARPRIDSTAERLAAIPGRPMSAFEAPDGCAFATRCLHVEERCRAAHPALRPSPAGLVRCVRAEEIHAAQVQAIHG